MTDSVLTTDKRALAEERDAQHAAPYPQHATEIRLDA